jgi:hypothetical protein
MSRTLRIVPAAKNEAIAANVVDQAPSNLARLNQRLLQEEVAEESSLEESNFLDTTEAETVLLNLVGAKLSSPSSDRVVFYQLPKRCNRNEDVFRPASH